MVTMKPTPDPLRPTNPRTQKYRIEGPINTPAPYETSQSTPYGTNRRSVAARPAVAPDTVPARPPKTIAERGLEPGDN